ncbi:hypothetical protein [Serratia odorifera]
MAAAALLKQTPHPSDEQIAAAMINLCRCGTITPSTQRCMRQQLR